MTIIVDPVAGSITGVTAPMAVGTAVSDTDAIQRQQKITLGTSVATTSVTSIDFTGIPSWVKRITVMLNGVSTSGVSPLQVQLGSVSIDTTSTYISTGVYLGASTAATSSTTGLLVTGATAAASAISGAGTISLQDSLKWVSAFNGRSETTHMMIGAGSKTLSGTLDRIRLTTVNGTDTFDAGSVNISYE